MPRQRRFRNDDDPIAEIFSSLLGLFLLFLAGLFFTNRPLFWTWASALIAVGIAIVVCVGTTMVITKKNSQKRRAALLNSIVENGQEDTINTFIVRNGMERTKTGWSYGDYHISWNSFNTLGDVLTERHVSLNSDPKRRARELNFILRHYIHAREDKLIREGLSGPNVGAVKKFVSLSGTEFETLLVRLYEAMGYRVEHTGRSGDQGADLIANKNGERIVVQAKRYSTWSVGNAAVQQVYTAAKIRDGGKAVVISSAQDFTREAREAAKATGVELISKDRLSELLLEYLHENWT